MSDVFFSDLDHLARGTAKAAIRPILHDKYNDIVEMGADCRPTRQ